MKPLDNELTYWDPLINALREEMGEYGGLLDLLGNQQKSILSRDTSGIASVNGQLKQQAQISEYKRARRQMIVDEIAVSTGSRHGTRLVDLQPLFPEKLKPMLDFLIEEINRLIESVRHKVRQNNLLLTRAAETTAALIDALSPDCSPRGYGRNGRRRSVAPASGLQLNLKA